MTESTQSEMLSLADFARHIGVSAPMVSKHKSAGRLVLDERGRVNAAESIKRIAATADPSHARKTHTLPLTSAACRNTSASSDGK